MNEEILPLKTTFPLESEEEMWSRIGARSASELELELTMNHPDKTGLIALPVEALGLGKIMYREDFQQIEINFQGEQRKFILSERVTPCPNCRSTPMMKTEPMAVYSFEAKMGFAIFCPTCGNETPLLKSSSDALRHWTLTSKLSV